MTEIKFPWIRRLLLTAVLVGALMAGGWYCYAWVLPGVAGPATSGKVSRASATARSELDRRLVDVLATLPGSPELLGDAELDRCLWPWDGESHERGPINCQRQHARYVVFKGSAEDAARSWSEALAVRGWTAHAAPLPPGTGYLAIRHYYVDQRNQDYLSVTIIGDSGSLPLLDNELRMEGTSQYRRDERKFGGLDAARRALVDGRQVAEFSLVRTYHSEGSYLQPPN